MGDPAAIPDPQELLAHGEFLRRLAARLLGDGAADDVVQETYAAALERPPPDRSRLPAWLARVARNLSLRRRRTEARRAAREARAPARAAAAATADIAARLEIQRLVVAAVTALPEPYRATVVLRYFDGLGPAEIARRTATSPRTVETRLRRALERLRADLDRRDRAWTLALLPLLRRPHLLLGGLAV
jgi:RNA polymerase sigma-70 factor (ECF subfamily)